MTSMYAVCTCMKTKRRKTNFSGTFSATFSGTRWTWPGPAPKIPKTFSGTTSATFSGTRWTWLGLHQSLPDLLRNLLRNPVEPDLPLHQSLPDLRNLLRNPVEPDLALHQSLPGLLWNLLRNPVEPNLALHQGLLEPSPEHSPESCWTWPGSAPKPPRHSPEPSPEPCWTWPGSAPKPPRPSPEPPPQSCWTWPGSAPKPSRPSPEPSERSPEPRWAWPGVCMSAHRSYSGLKTPLAYAVGESKYGGEKKHFRAGTVPRSGDCLEMGYTSQMAILMWSNVLGSPIRRHTHILTLGILPRKMGYELQNPPELEGNYHGTM